MKRTIFTVVVCAAAMLGLAVPAAAVNHGILDDRPVEQGVWKHYDNPRHVRLDESFIFVKKTDGPKIGIRWRKCDGSAHGQEFILRNEDPTERRLISTSLNAGTCFKLSVKSYGENPFDTWDGEIWWNTRT